MKGTPFHHVEGYYQGTGSVRLFEQIWKPSVKPIGVIVIVHGLLDHSGYYSETAVELVNSGYAVYAFDLRGHGRSEGERSYVDSFQEYLSDLDIFLRRVRDEQLDQRLFLLGHSMGGAIVTSFILGSKPTITGLMLSGAALKTGKEISKATKALTPVLSRIAPKVKALKLDIGYVSRNPDIVARKRADPLIDQGKIPVRTAAELLKTIGQIQDKMENMTIPTLIMHGTADKWTNPQGSQELYNRSRAEDKTLRLYDGFYHEILSDPERARVQADIVQWLGNHSS